MKRLLLLVLLVWLVLDVRPVDATCRPIQEVGRVSSVTRTIHPLPWPVRWTVGGWTLGVPPKIFLVVTRERFPVGARVLVTGCLVGDEIRSARLVWLY